MAYVHKVLRKRRRFERLRRRRGVYRRGVYRARNLKRTRRSKWFRRRVKAVVTRTLDRRVEKKISYDDQYGFALAGCTGAVSYGTMMSFQPEHYKIGTGTDYGQRIGNVIKFVKWGVEVHWECGVPEIMGKLTGTTGLPMYVDFIFGLVKCDDISATPTMTAALWYHDDTAPWSPFGPILNSAYTYESNAHRINVKKLMLKRVKVDPKIEVDGATEIVSSKGMQCGKIIKKFKLNTRMYYNGPGTSGYQIRGWTPVVCAMPHTGNQSACWMSGLEDASGGFRWSVKSRVWYTDE